MTEYTNTLLKVMHELDNNSQLQKIQMISNISDTQLLKFCTKYKISYSALYKVMTNYTYNSDNINDYITYKLTKSNNERTKPFDKIIEKVNERNEKNGLNNITELNTNIIDGFIISCLLTYITLDINEDIIVYKGISDYLTADISNHYLKFINTPNIAKKDVNELYETRSKQILDLIKVILRNIKHIGEKNNVLKCFNGLYYNFIVQQSHKYNIDYIFLPLNIILRLGLNGIKLSYSKTSINYSKGSNLCELMRTYIFTNKIERQEREDYVDMYYKDEVISKYKNINANFYKYYSERYDYPNVFLKPQKNNIYINKKIWSSSLIDSISEDYATQKYKILKIILPKGSQPHIHYINSVKRTNDTLLYEMLIAPNSIFEITGFDDKYINLKYKDTILPNSDKYIDCMRDILNNYNNFELDQKYFDCINEFYNELK